MAYSVFGAFKDTSLSHIKKLYRNFLRTHHPDKAKEKVDTELIGQFQHAYDLIVEHKKYNKAEEEVPIYDIEYEVENDLTISKPDNLTHTNFNEEFELQQKINEENGFGNPFAIGYDDFSSKHPIEGEIVVPSYSIDDIDRSVPLQRVDHQLQIYKEPAIQYAETSEFASSLGLTKISDFSTKFSGGLGGADLDLIYGKDHEFLENSYLKTDTDTFNHYNEEEDIDELIKNRENDRSVFIQPSTRNDQILFNDEWTKKMDTSENFEQYQKENKYFNNYRRLK